MDSLLQPALTVPADLDPPSGQQPGPLSRVLIRMLMKQAQVVASVPAGPDFRLITLQSPEFIGVQWVPGQKVQIAMGSAFVARTFTPIDWDAIDGRTRILGYAHGTGPGSAWVRNASPGDACDVFGPRASLDINQAGRQCVVLGDETSIGVAYAFSRHAQGRSVQCLLEVSRLAPAVEALARLGLEGVELFARRDNDAQLAELERRLPELAASGASFVLTGKAQSIQHLRRSLKALGVASSRCMTKAYWAPGKTGLD